MEAGSSISPFVVGGFSFPFFVDLLESVCGTSPKRINRVVLSGERGEKSFCSSAAGGSHSMLSALVLEEHLSLNLCSSKDEENLTHLTH